MKNAQKNVMEERSARKPRGERRGKRCRPSEGRSMARCQAAPRIVRPDRQRSRTARTASNSSGDHSPESNAFTAF